jgi:fatty-acyl-CoA synthase
MKHTAHPTVLHAFLGSLQAEPDRLALRMVDRTGGARELSRAELFRAMSCVIAGFHSSGIRPGDRLILALPTSVELIALYLGALFSGVIPIIEPAPRDILSNGFSSLRLESFQKRLDAAYTIVPQAVIPESGASQNLRLLSVEQLVRHEPLDKIVLTANPDEVAHLQATSGSTGSQRIAAITHRNIAANTSGIGAHIELRVDDGLMFWLPLYHDMGLIAVSCALNWGLPMTLTDASNFSRNPIRFWWQLISSYRATITAAPNSAYEACARLASVRRFDNLDLSVCRLAFWGAEPVHAETVRSFEQVFAPYGYRREATLPVYGLAEATLAATIPQVGVPPSVDLPGREISASHPIASVAREVISVGRPLPGHQIRLVDAGRELKRERQTGEIEIAGPSIVKRYWDPVNNSKGIPEPDGFLRTGDLGYIHGGNLYIIGRRKEIIIIHGRNFVPAGIEAFVEKIVHNRIPKGVAAFGVFDSTSRTEALHLMVESRVLPIPACADLEERIRTAVADEFGIGGAVIHWVSKGKIPKTTSGKLQRFRCKELIASAHENSWTALRDGRTQAGFHRTAVFAVSPAITEPGGS